MGKGYQRKSYHEVRGYRMSDHTVSDISDIAKENYYALAIAVIKGWSTDYCLAQMGVAADRKEYTRKSEAPFMQSANLSYVLNKICGLSYTAITKCTNISYNVVRDGVIFVAGKRQKRTKAKKGIYESKKCNKL